MRYASPSPSHDAPPSPKIRACIICYITSNISQSIAYPITSFFTPQTISTTRISSALPFPSFNAHNGQAKTTTLACYPHPFATTTPLDGQAGTIARAHCHPPFATTTPFGQKPFATTYISNSTHEDP